MVLHKHVVKVHHHYIEVSMKYYSHNTILRSPSGRSALTNQLHVCDENVS